VACFRPVQRRPATDGSGAWGCHELFAPKIASGVTCMDHLGRRPDLVENVPWRGRAWGPARYGRALVEACLFGCLFRSTGDNLLRFAVSGLTLGDRSGFAHRWGRKWPESVSEPAPILVHPGPDPKSEQVSDVASQPRSNTTPLRATQVAAATAVEVESG